MQTVFNDFLKSASQTKVSIAFFCRTPGCDTSDTSAVNIHFKTFLLTSFWITKLKTDASSIFLIFDSGWK